MSWNPLTWLRRRPPALRRAARWPLTRELLRWTPADPFTLDDACKGVQVWGMTGSGKTSGSGRALALAYLRAGFGGLVLCAKPDEYALWQEYAAAAGRSADLVRFAPGEPGRFNPLDHEARRPGAGAGLTENVVALLLALAEAADRGAAAGGGRDDDSYWRKALAQLLRNAIDVVVPATGGAAVADLYRLAASAPTSLDQVADPGWRGRSACWELLQRADAAAAGTPRVADFALAVDYWLCEFPGLSDKTRSVILSTFTGTADVLNRGLLRELFGTTTTLTPDDCLGGKVVVVDLPVKTFAEVGSYAAAIWKQQFQKAVERRPAEADPRPVFLFADESHLFAAKGDALFQTTARSARCCTVYLTQNLNNYRAAYPGPGGEAVTKSLLGNLTHQVVHALGDADTAEYIAGLVGRTRQAFASGNLTLGPYHPVDDLLGRESGQASGGFSEHMEYEVPPAELARLGTGGPPAFAVEALVWRGGRAFRSTNRNHTWATFSQKGA